MLLRHVSAVSSWTVVLATLLAGALGAWPAAAQTQLLNQVHTIAAPTTGVPQEYTFSVTTAGAYTVTLTDLGAALLPTPAPLASVKLAVSGGDALVGSPLVGAGTLTLTLPSGNYRVHVVGMPGNVPGSGPFGIQVNDASMTPIAAFQGVLALPSGALPNGEGVLDSTFVVSSTGSYTVTLTDLKLPQSLTTLTLLLIAQGGATPVLILPASGAFQQTVTLTAGVTYDIFAVGQANASAAAGLYSAVVTAGSGGTGAVVFARAVPVGATLHLGSPALAAGSYTLSAADLAFPAALSQLGAALLLNGQPVAQLSHAGSSPFSAAAGTYEAYAVATAATAAPGAGSYAFQVKAQGGGTPAFAVARGVTGTGSTLSAYSFDAVAATGAESVTLTDFVFPAPLTSVSVAAAQGGAILGTPVTAPGSFNISATSGPLSLVAFAQPGSGTAGGLFGVEVAPAAGGTAVLDVTQAVGAIFTTQKITVSAAGAYAVTATDLGFPAAFANYDTIVTQGKTQAGAIYGGGTFNFPATPGDYDLNFIAQTTGSDQAGTYALTVASAPPAPTVSLSVDNPQVASGSTVDLIWSSENAASCTASGGWSGTQALMGTATSAALTSNTTFTLSCTGAGGTTSKSVSVTIAPAKGGGGALGLESLVLLSVLLAARCRRLLSQRAAAA